MPPIVATTTTVPPATTVPSTTTAPVATTVPAVTTAPPTTTTTPPPLKTDPPVVLAPIFDVDTVVNGTSVEADGTVIQAYINDQPASWTTTVTGGAWAMTGLDLTACDTVKATAKALDKELSDDSNEVPVLPLALWGDPCECAPPTSDCDPAGVRTFQLTLKVEGEGDILPALGTTTHVASDRIRLTAVPAQGWELLRWRAEVPAHTTWSSVPAISNLTDISLIHTVREDAIIIAEFTRCTVPTAA